MNQFENFKPSTESYWRSIILFGRNVASYKFALGKALLELVDKEKTSVTLEELSLPFAKHITNHLRISDKQGTFSSSRFLDACRKFNQGEINGEDLRKITVKHGFENVIDAFHHVNQDDVPIRFFIDERSGSNRIVLTDDLLKLKESYQIENLTPKIEARWRLVETAWSLNISRNLIKIKHNEEENLFYVETDKIRRINITSARDALNGYQKGKCFYCFADISIESKSENLADVDHFFPHTLRLLDITNYSSDINGI
jgi:hypothetical protein